MLVILSPLLKISHSSWASFGLWSHFAVAHSVDLGLVGTSSFAGRLRVMADAGK